MRLAARVEAGLSQLQAEVATLHGNGADTCKRLEAVEQKFHERCMPGIPDEQKAAGPEVLEHGTTKLEIGNSPRGKDDFTDAQFRALLNSVAILQDTCVAHSEALDRELSQRVEMQAHLEARLETALSRGIREQLLVESEGLHATLLQEKRERTDGQRSLQAVLTSQRQAISQVATRSDMDLGAVRAHLERLERFWSTKLLECEGKLAQLILSSMPPPCSGLGARAHLQSHARAASVDPHGFSRCTSPLPFEATMNASATPIATPAEEDVASSSARKERADRLATIDSDIANFVASRCSGELQPPDAAEA